MRPIIITTLYLSNGIFIIFSDLYISAHIFLRKFDIGELAIWSIYRVCKNIRFYVGEGGGQL